jgi:hypothetical protein
MKRQAIILMLASMAFACGGNQEATEETEVAEVTEIVEP